MQLLCEKESLISSLQREMFSKSRKELLAKCEECNTFALEYFNRLSKSKIFPELNVQESDMGIYSHNYGLSSIEKPSDPEATKTQSNIDKSDTLAYYRIWKNANDHIRRVMFHYSSLNSITFGCNLDYLII